MRALEYIIFASSLLPMRLAAQNQPAIVPDTPPSPQAVAFNRLGDYEMNNNYGAPDISIPLFEIDFHGYKIPLALHYEASPLKPGYNYDVTGLGWTLSGNSCVSRTIRDRADELAEYSFSKPFVLESPSDYSKYDYADVDFSKYFDSVNFQYDTYNIALPSGRNIPFFMYMWNNEMKFDISGSEEYVKIACDWDRSNAKHTINGFTVTDESGVVYKFTKAETGSNNLQNDPNYMVNVTWLLTSIDIPAKGTISYEYYDDKLEKYAHVVDEPAMRIVRYSSQMPEDGKVPRLGVFSISQNQSPRYEMRLLKSIAYDDARVNFNYSDGHMSSIVVTDKQDTVRTFKLNIGGSSLTSLVISGKDGKDGKDELVYGFGYQPNDYQNNNQGLYTDYWGNLCRKTQNNHDVANFNLFFNNKEDGTWLSDARLLQKLDSTLVRFVPNKDTDVYYYSKIKLQNKDYGDLRQPSSPEHHGVLRSITYPNGGTTFFTFENHRFPTATAADGDLVFDRRRQRIIEGGGFRIKSVINYAADGTIASQDHYRYGFAYGDIARSNFPLPLPSSYDEQEHIGCGEAVVDPNILTFLNDFSCFGISFRGHEYGYDFQKMIIGLKSNLFEKTYDVRGSATWWEAEFSASAFRSLIGGRRPVVYPEVTVYHGNPDECKSKTVYKYDIYNYQYGGCPSYFNSIRDMQYVRDTTYFEPLHYYNPTLPRLMSDRDVSGKGHQLKTKEEYSYNAASRKWELASEEKYKYNYYYFSKSGSVYGSNISRKNYTYATTGNQKWYNNCQFTDFYKPVSRSLGGKSELCEKSTTTFRKGGRLADGNTVTEEYEYFSPGVLKRKMAYAEDRIEGETCSFVGEQDDGNATVRAMKERNMLAYPVASTTYSDQYGYGPFAVSGSRTEYRTFAGGAILPSKSYDFNMGDCYYYEDDNIEDGEYEPSVEILSYDGYGNPTEFADLKTGMHSVILWDGTGRHMAAMIRNAKLSDIGSNAALLLTKDSQARHAELQKLLPNSLIETWDYKPLVGETAHTDESGSTVLYGYDELGRLVSEKRKVNGVEEPVRMYEYNFLNQSY